MRISDWSSDVCSSDLVEVPIPAADAEELLALRQGAVIEKQRYRVPFGGLVWDVDVFGGENAGLVIAEVEVPAADHAVALPAWAGTEVTGDARDRKSTRLNSSTSCQNRMPSTG